MATFTVSPARHLPLNTRSMRRDTCTTRFSAGGPSPRPPPFLGGRPFGQPRARLGRQHLHVEDVRGLRDQRARAWEQELDHVVDPRGFGLAMRTARIFTR